MRRFFRHPANIPFDFSLNDVVAHKTEYLLDVSVGGLSFRSNVPIQKGSRIHIRIPLLKPVFDMEGQVAWCQKKKDHFAVGVKFMEAETRFKARMFEQVCFIEEYKRQIRENEGRQISGEQAAIEWIEKFAKDFSE